MRNRFYFYGHRSMTFDSIEKRNLKKKSILLIKAKMKLKVDTTRQIKAYLESNKTVFLRRGTIDPIDNYLIFIERHTKSIIKFNPFEETFFNSIQKFDMKDPFAIRHFSNGYVACDHCSVDCSSEEIKIKIFNKEFNVLQSFVANELLWPHDIAFSKNENFMFISDFSANFVFKFELAAGCSELRQVAKFRQIKALDIKVSFNKIFVVCSCDYSIEAMKLIYVNGSGNSIDIYDVDTLQQLHKLSHPCLLEPQGLYIDEINGFCYVAGLFVDEETRLVHDDLHLFCFDLFSYQFSGSQSLCINFDITICDLFFWNDVKKNIKKLFLSAFKDGIYAIDVE